MNITTTTTQELREAVRTPFAWPGGYPVYVVLSDGGLLCHTCARTKYKQLSQALRDPALTHSGWRPIGADVLWEVSEDGPELCANCNKPLESAY